MAERSSVLLQCFFGRRATFHALPMPTRRRRRPITTAPKSRPKARARAPRNPRRSRPGVLTALLVLVAGGAVVAAILSLQSAPATLVSERTVTVTRGVIQTVVSGSGNLAPARQVDVDFATSGKITKVYTKAGAHVSEGELLARIDNRSQKVDVAKAEAALVDAQDALAEAQDAEASGTTSTSTSTDTTTTASAAMPQASATSIAVVAQPTPTGTPGATETPAGTTTPSPTATPRGGATPTVTATP